MTGTPSAIRILAVEDDPIYKEGLDLLFAEMGYNNFKIVDNAKDALKDFQQTPPDLLLMDIEISGSLNGIEFVELVSGVRKTPVIYVTAFSDEETFNKAKRTFPSAYIIKPYTARNLQLAMELAIFKNDMTGDGNDYAPYNLNSSRDAVFVRYNNKLVKVPLSDLVYIEVDEKYCYLYTNDKRFAVNMRLKNLLEELSANNFIQTHRSFAVRLDAIDEVNLEENMIKISGREIPIGKTYRDLLFAKLKMI